MAIHAAVEILADRSPDEWLAKIMQVNPGLWRGLRAGGPSPGTQPPVQGRHRLLSQGNRADPQLWSARSQLGINLMRLGQEDEPRQQLEMCYDNGYRDAATVNSLRLLDSYKNFVTFKDDTTILQAQ